MQNRNIFKQYYKIGVWVGVIAYLCLAPANEFKRVHISIPYFDKAVHFAMFLILAFLISAKDKVYYSRNTQYLLFFMAALYGGLIELAQYYITNTRSADWIDWAADIFGVVVGIVLFGFLPNWMRRLLT